MEVQFHKGRIAAVLCVFILPALADPPASGSGHTFTPSSAQSIEIGTVAENSTAAEPVPVQEPEKPKAAAPAEPEPKKAESKALPPRTGKAALPSKSPNETQQGSTSIPWYRNGMLVLAGVLVLIVVLSKLVKKYVPTAKITGSDSLQVIARTHISPKQSVALVRVGNNIIIVGITADRLTRLGEITDQQECFNLVTSKGSRSRNTNVDTFDRVLEKETEAFDEALQETRIPQAATESSPQVQQTVGHLRNLVTRLKTLQETQPLD